MVIPFNPEDALGSPLVEQAVIKLVDTDKCTADVMCIVSHRQLTNIPYTTPFIGYAGAGGIDFGPEPETLCYVLTPSDGTGSFIFAYTMAPAPSDDNDPRLDGGDTSYRGRRKRTKQGEILLSNRDGVFVELLRGGVLRAGSNARCQSLYIPIENLIRHFYDKVEHITPMGEFSWGKVELGSETDGDEEAEDGRCLFRANFRDKVARRNFSLELAIGTLSGDVLDGAVDSNLLRRGKATRVSVLGDNENVEITEDNTGLGDREHFFGAGAEYAEEDSLFTPYTIDSGNHGILSLVFRDEDDNTQWFFQLDRNGQVCLGTKQHIHAEVRSLVLRATDKVKVDMGGGTHIELAEYIHLRVGTALLDILSSGDVTLQGTVVKLVGTQSLTLETPGEIILKSGTAVTLDTPRVNLGKGANLDLLANATSFKTTLDAHGHPAPSPAVSPSPVPVTGNGVLTSNTSTKVFVKG